ncbi:hypothetical protein F7725_020125 [Dissostichus mawsoni]|uniref:Uncharacterized protein n=1 Tax=Dissostichus mawsoni TaxID=36200 RepID=A0A7J5YEY1_DISMA|nr:hypothetical protein F7725_020125 [Dissostichus mawsoni]
MEDWTTKGYVPKPGEAAPSLAARNAIMNYEKGRLAERKTSSEKEQQQPEPVTDEVEVTAPSPEPASPVYPDLSSLKKPPPYELLSQNNPFLPSPPKAIQAPTFKHHNLTGPYGQEHHKPSNHITPHLEEEGPEEDTEAEVPPGTRTAFTAVPKITGTDNAQYTQGTPGFSLLGSEVRGALEGDHLEEVVANLPMPVRLDPCGTTHYSK